MDFIFKDSAELNNQALTQGDVIGRSQNVIERIGQAHQYYADPAHYSHFMVLTQSCDLVKRQGRIKAPYITIAAVKPFSKTMGSFFDVNLKTIEGSSFTFHSESLKAKAKQLVERHINNTEPEFFFLPKSGHPSLPEDLVVFLRLTIALRTEHYDALAEAKIAELSDVFQAKLGWLKGNIYSRVATPDIEERDAYASKTKNEFYSKYIPTNDRYWLSALQANFLRKIVEQRREELGRDLTDDEVADLIADEVPEDIRIIAKNIVERFKKNNLIEEGDEDAESRFTRAIMNEPSFKTIVKSNS